MTETQWYEIKLKDSFSPALKGVEKHTNAFEGQIASLGKTISGVFAAGLIIGGIEQLGASIIKLGGDMQQTRIAFDVMLGSAEKSKQMIAELQEFARVTPFDTPEVIEAGKQLLAYGVKAGNITKELTALGNVASGLKIPLGELNYLYGTLKASGRVTSIDIKQFAGRGIPIFEELAKVLKIDSRQVLQFATDGKISFRDVQQAFQNMTTGTGRFTGLMERESKSLFGQWSNFKALLEETGIGIGERMIPSLTAGLGTLSTLTEEFINADWSPLLQSLESVGHAIGAIEDTFARLFEQDENDNVWVKIFKSLLSIIPAVGLLVETLLLTVEKLGALITLDFEKFKKTENYYDLWKKRFDEYDQANADSEEHSRLKSFRKVFGQGTAAEIMERLNLQAGGVKRSVFDEDSVGASKGMKGGHALGVEKVQSATKTITLNITNLVKEIKFERGLIENGNEARMVEMIKQVLLTAVNDVNLISN